MKCKICGMASAERTKRARDIKCVQCRFAANLWKNYKITLDVYNTLLKSQDYRCAICSKWHEDCKLPGRSKRNGLMVDHCHITGRVRGLLCHSCNTLLGASNDRTDTLTSAIAYL